MKKSSTKSFFSNASNHAVHKSDLAQSGFSLIEVIITISIMLAMTVAVVGMIRNGFEVRKGLSESSRVISRLNNAMERVSRDIELAYLVSKTDNVRFSVDRRMGTVFRVEQSSDTDKLWLTTLSHRPYSSNSGEPDQMIVVYEVKDDPKITGRKHLYRGISRITGDKFRELPEMHLLAAHIKKFKIIAWRGDQWLKDRWDTERSDTANKLPRMVRIEIASWAEDLEPGDVADPTHEDNVVEMKTIVSLPMALAFPEIKTQVSSISWWAGRE